MSKFSKWQTDDSFLIFLENRIRHFMQIVSSGDDLHEMSNCVHWKKEETVVNLLSAELVKVNKYVC